MGIIIIIINAVFKLLVIIIILSLTDFVLCEIL